MQAALSDTTQRGGEMQSVSLPISNTAVYAIPTQQAIAVLKTY